MMDEAQIGRRVERPELVLAAQRTAVRRIHTIYGADDRELRSHPAAQCAEPERLALAKILSSYPEVVAELGGMPEAILEEAGIPPWALNHPSAKVPLHAVGHLLESTAARLGCPDFGMRLAERQALIPTMKPLDRLLLTAPRMRDSIICTIEHMSAFNSGLMMDLDEAGESGLHLVSFQLLDGLSLFPQLMEQFVLLGQNSIILMSAGFARSRRIWFSHLNVSPPVVYAKRFNTVVEFGQEYDGYFLSTEDLETHAVDCNPDWFASESRSIAIRYPPQRKDIGVRVRHLVFRTLTNSEGCTRRRIASLLGLQERTLNRRLSKKGTSFEAIRDEVRKNMTYRYLARADLSLTEIAGRLAYSELAVLSRSCRRWFGTSPRRLRQRLLCRASRIPIDGVDRA